VRTGRDRGITKRSTHFPRTPDAGLPRRLACERAGRRRFASRVRRLPMRPGKRVPGSRSFVEKTVADRIAVCSK